MKRKICTSPTLESLEWRTLLSHYFVATTGSDQNPGTDELPWRSLQFAARTVIAGDTVTVRAGDYIGFSLSWDFPQNGTAEAPITFKADPGVTINARNPKTVDGIDFEGSSYIIIDGFNIIPDVNQEVWRAGIRVAGGGVGNIIRNNTVAMRADDRYGIFSSFASELLVQNNNVSGTRNSGIYTSNSADHPTIRGNTVHSTGGNGIHFNGDISQGGDGLISYALVENNTIYDVGAVVGGSAINMDGIQYSRIQNNLLYNNHAKGITLYHIDAAEGSKYNVVANNTVVQASNATGYALSLKSGSTFNSVFNNILIGGSGFSGAMNVTDDSLAGLYSDYNIVQDAFTINDGISNISLSSWKAAQHQDLHSSVATAAAIFVDPAANDYHLISSSPAINAGTNVSLEVQAPTTDINGVVRPNGQNWDAGAYEFIGPADVTAPVISNIVISDIKAWRITISWTTSEPATGRVEYGTGAGYGTLTSLQGVLLLNHSVTITGLSADTLYHFRLLSGDVVGNIGMSADQTITTPPPDLTPPTQSGIAAAAVAPVYAVIKWTTDEPADSLVEFGDSIAYGSSVSASALIGSHSLKLTGLLPSTTYHFRVKSRDESLNQSVSNDMTFTTSAIGSLPAGATGYWTFGEFTGTTTLDASGNNHTGTTVNGPEFVPGVSGNALNFDGSNDGVRVHRAPDLESAAVTVTAWVKLAAETQSSWAVIAKKTFANDSISPYGSYSLAMSPGGLGNILSFYTGHVAGSDELDSPAEVPTGRWVFLAGTFDPVTGVKRLYIDGELVASDVVATPLIYDATSSGDLYFGQDPGLGEAFSGFIDNVGIWDRALSPSEVATLGYVVPATSILGTAGDDTVHLTLLSPSQLQVQVNNNPSYLLDPGLLSEIQINTLGGSDTLIFSATEGADVVLFSARGITYQTLSMPITHINVETVLFDSGGGTDRLFVSSESIVGLASDLRVNELQIVLSSALDLRDKQLTVDDGPQNSTPIEVLEYMIRNARNEGYWDHAGIRSSSADSTTWTVAAFANQAAGTITVKNVRYGDANGDGAVDIQDLYTLAMHWRQSASRFTVADFNYDGVVDAKDLQLLGLNWQAGPAAQGLMVALGLVDPSATPARHEPEPAPAPVESAGEEVEPGIPIVDEPLPEPLPEPLNPAPVEPPPIPAAPAPPVSLTLPSTAVAVVPAAAAVKESAAKTSCNKSPFGAGSTTFNKWSAPQPEPKPLPKSAPKPAPFSVHPISCVPQSANTYTARANLTAPVKKEPPAPPPPSPKPCGGRGR